MIPCQYQSVDTVRLPAEARETLDAVEPAALRRERLHVLKAPAYTR
jgi:hypothetical protein